jgi:hypothetical protein
MAVGLALPLPAMSGALPWHAEHVLGDQDVENPGLSNHIERGGVDIGVIRLDVRVPRGAFREYLAEENEAAEHVGLVDAGDPARRAPGLALARQIEGKIEQPLRRAARDGHGIVGGAVVLKAGLAARAEQALGGFPNQDEIEVLAARVGERHRQARKSPHRAHPREQLELFPHVQLRRDLAAVGIADVRQSHGAEQDGVGGLSARQRRLGQRRATALVVGRAGLQGFESEREAA